ncbi:hypothetical protein N431DRAFT_418721 [Stipitochalara longipes BDJ]|nr:hypothetical protein N431DRAFT_418721 [Stipitochalara longipes BDJ]
MAELMLKPPQTIGAEFFEWPKVPESKIESKEGLDEPLESLVEERPEPQPLRRRVDKITEKIETINPLDNVQTQSSEVNHSPASPKVEEANKAETRERRSTKLGLFGLKKAQWPNPHLSLGIQCNRLGSNECWQAVGPAQDLFGLVSKSIGDLLDARVEDLEEGEPVAGHILLFGMYMIGKSATTAQPTLLLTCQRPKPRRRAIKYIRESGILKGYPKILLAESSLPPLASGTSSVRLLAGRDSLMTAVARRGLNSVGAEPLLSSTILRRDATPTPVYTPSTKASFVWIAGPILGTILGLATVFVVILFTRRKQRREHIRAAISSDSEVLGDQQNHPKLPPHDALILSDTDSPSLLPQGLSTTNIMSQSSALPSNSPEMAQVKVSEPFKISSDRSHLWPDGTFGIPILCSASQKRASIGEVVCINGKSYGLTAAHPFYTHFDTTTADELSSECQEIDPEFAFIDEEEEEFGEVEMSEIAITSQASMSSADSAAGLSRSNTTASTVSHIEVDNTISRAPVDNSVVLRFREGGLGTSLAEERSEIGHLSASSHTEADLGLDWALIELLEPNVYEDRRLLALPHSWTGKARQVLSKPSVGKHVLAATGYSGVIGGFLLPGSTKMRLTPRGKFQEVWAVQLDKAIDKGDSGTSVVDAASGDLYGHIVAGTPGGQVAYIMPASRVFGEIENLLGQVTII